MHVVGGVVFN